MGLRLWFGPIHGVLPLLYHAWACLSRVRCLSPVVTRWGQLGVNLRWFSYIVADTFGRTCDSAGEKASEPERGRDRLTEGNAYLALTGRLKNAGACASDWKDSRMRRDRMKWETRGRSDEIQRRPMLD